MGFVKEISQVGKKKLNAEEKKKASELIEKHRKEDARLVKGVFKNIEAPGGDVTFAIRLYKGDPVVQYYFIDNEEAEIPIGVAKHINRQCKYKKSKYLLDKNGKRIVGTGTPIQRYQFVSEDFM